jgi:lipoprotein-anchoring transpeptidase ErfK/SrfK
LNASLGRFLSTDPQDSDPEKPETLNVYRYAANDPVSMVDPSGRSDLLSIATVTAAVSVLSTLSLPATSWAAKPAREIVVDVNTQRVFSLARGVTFRTMEGITGDGEHPTPRGSFRIRSKRREYRSKKYDAQMNYAMFFNGGVALHQFHGPPGSFWLIRALKTGVSDYFGSHGCVRLTEEDAETLFDWAAVNDPVTVK